MAFPDSWAFGKRELADFVTPIQSFGSDTIYMEEKTGDVSPRQTRLSRGVDSAATMTFCFEQRVFEDTFLMPIITKSILGGYWPADGKRYPPMVHPYWPGMWAKDLVGVTSVGAMETPLPKKIANYGVAEVTISFESLPYLVKKESLTSQYNTSWIEIGLRSSNQRVSTPLGWYSISTGPYTGFPAMAGQYLVQPSGYLEIVIHEVPHNRIFTTDDSLKSTLAQFFGFVNSTEFATYPAQSLLLDSAEVRPYQDWLGNRLYDLKMSLLYNGWGWNKSLDPGANLQSVTFLGTGTGPFTTFNLVALINNLNPIF